MLLLMRGQILGKRVTGLHTSEIPSSLFDAEWYLAQNPVVRDSGINPLKHYLRIGAATGCNPNPLFNTAIYVKAHGGSISAGEALMHFYKSRYLVAPGAYRSPDVLITLQRSYQAKTKMKCIEDRCSGQKRFAVYVQCGSGSTHGQWLTGNQRPWDLIINHYDGTYVSKIPCDLEFQQVGLEPGTKFTSFLTVLTKWPHYIHRYDYIMLLDDDIIIEEKDIADLFTIVEEHALDLSQASLSSDSYCSHPVTKNQGTKGLRYVSAVEIMMPVLSKRAIHIGRHLFSQTISGWGLDIALGKLVAEKLNGRAVIIDDIIAQHTKPIDVENGAFYRMLHHALIYPQIEAANIQRIYKLGRITLK